MNDRSQPYQRSRLLALGLALAAVLAFAPAASAAATSRQLALPAAALRPVSAAVLSASAFSFGRTVLRSDLPVIVDFWAPWCIPCKELDAPMREVAAKLAGRVRVVRVNLDWSGGVAHRYGVQSVPTVLIFNGGELVGRSSGGASAQDLEDLVAASILPAGPG